MTSKTQKDAVDPRAEDQNSGTSGGPAGKPFTTTSLASKIDLVSSPGNNDLNDDNSKNTSVIQALASSSSPTAEDQNSSNPPAEEKNSESPRSLAASGSIRPI